VRERERERERVCMCLLEKMCERERTKRSKKFGYKKTVNGDCKVFK
jgi:hypothetical protein